MKLTDIILEYTDAYKSIEASLARDIERSTDSGDCYVSMGDYAGGRPDDDPLKDMSFGTVTFKTSNDFEEGHWDKIKKYVESRGYDITQDSPYFDEDPGERYYYPSIKFHFKTPSK
jgi:hypothetical protein